MNTIYENGTYQILPLFLLRNNTIKDSHFRILTLIAGNNTSFSITTELLIEWCHLEIRQLKRLLADMLELKMIEKTSILSNSKIINSYGINKDFWQGLESNYLNLNVKLSAMSKMVSHTKNVIADDKNGKELEPCYVKNGKSTGSISPSIDNSQTPIFYIKNIYNTNTNIIDNIDTKNVIADDKKTKILHLLKNYGIEKNIINDFYSEIEKTIKDDIDLDKINNLKFFNRSITILDKEVNKSERNFLNNIFSIKNNLNNELSILDDNQIRYFKSKVTAYKKIELNEESIKLSYFKISNQNTFIESVKQLFQNQKDLEFLNYCLSQYYSFSCKDSKFKHYDFIEAVKNKSFKSYETNLEKYKNRFKQENKEFLELLGIKNFDIEFFNILKSKIDFLSYAKKNYLEFDNSISQNKLLNVKNWCLNLLKVFSIDQIELVLELAKIDNNESNSNLIDSYIPKIKYLMNYCQTN